MYKVDQELAELMRNLVTERGSGQAEIHLRGEESKWKGKQVRRRWARKRRRPRERKQV